MSEPILWKLRLLMRVSMMMKSWLLLALGLSAFAQPEEPLLFKAEVSLVRVDARVALPNGSTVSGLRAEDFVIFDETTQVKPVDFTSESEVVPVNVLLLLDVSDSMRPYLRELSEKASEALRVLRPSDRVALMIFSQTSQMVQPFTTEVGVIPSRIVNSIYKQSVGRTTFVNEALIEAAKALSSEKGRRALLIVTDNEGFRNAVRDAEVSRALQGNDIVMSAIIAGTGTGLTNVSRYTNPETAAPDITRFVEATGGSIVRKQAPGTALSGLLKDAVTRYVLQYPAPPAESGTFRKIRVELTPAIKARYPNAQVQARTGYQVGGQ